MRAATAGEKQNNVSAQGGVIEVCVCVCSASYTVFHGEAAGFCELVIHSASESVREKQKKKE